MSDDRYPPGVYGEGRDPDARFSLANERTFLAWTRTALALVAGSVAVHSPLVDLPGWTRDALSLGLLVLAALCAALAWSRWRAVERSLRTGSPGPGFAGPAVLAGAVGLLVAVVATGVVVSLIG